MESRAGGDLYLNSATQVSRKEKWATERQTAIMMVCNHIFSAVKFLTWSSMGTDSVLETESSGHVENCSVFNMELYGACLTAGDKLVDTEAFLFLWLNVPPPCSSSSSSSSSLWFCYYTFSKPPPSPTAAHLSLLSPPPLFPLLESWKSGQLGSWGVKTNRGSWLAAGRRSEPAYRKR